MAVITGLEGAEVQIIEKGGAALTEYTSDEDHAQTEATYSTERYIEAKSGAQFGIRFKVAPLPALMRILAGNAVSVKVALDGKVVNSRVLKPASYLAGFDEWAVISRRGGVDFEHDLHFSALDIGKYDCLHTTPDLTIVQWKIAGKSLIRHWLQD